MFIRKRRNDRIVNNFDRLNAIESNLARQLGWIAAADSKVSFIFTVATAMLGVLAAISPRAGCAWSTASAVFALLAAACGLLALLFLSFVTFPRTNGPRNSLIFFGEIAKDDPASFQDAISKLSYETYVADLTSQCFRNAEIAAHKFRWLRRAMVLLYLSILPWGIAIFLLNGS